MADSGKVQPLFVENFRQFSTSNIEGLGTKCGCRDRRALVLYHRGMLIFHCDNSFILDGGTCEVDVPALVLSFNSQELLQAAADKLQDEVVVVRCGTCDQDWVLARWLRDEGAMQVYCSACQRNLTPPLPLASDTLALS